MEEMEMVEEILRKSLKKTDVTARLSVPSKSLKKWPSFEGRHHYKRRSTNTSTTTTTTTTTTTANNNNNNVRLGLQVKDVNGSLWSFRCALRKKGYRKPVLSGDWHRFVMSKGLGIGDEIRIFKDHNLIKVDGVPADYFRVEVKKAVMVFGVVIGHAPAYVI